MTVHRQFILAALAALSVALIPGISAADDDDDGGGTGSVEITNFPALQSVEVTNFPAVKSVEEVNNPAFQPYREASIGSIVPGADRETIQFPIPLGKRLVIEHVAAQILVDLPSADPVEGFRVQLNTFSDGISGPILLNRPQEIGTFGSEVWYGLSQSLRLYADRADGVQDLRILIVRDDTDGTDEFAVNVLGYVVDIP